MGPPSGPHERLHTPFGPSGAAAAASGPTGLGPGQSYGGSPRSGLGSSAAPSRRGSWNAQDESGNPRPSSSSASFGPSPGSTGHMQSSSGSGSHRLASGGAGVVPSSSSRSVLPNHPSSSSSPSSSSQSQSQSQSHLGGLFGSPPMSNGRTLPLPMPLPSSPSGAPSRSPKRSALPMLPTPTGQLPPPPMTVPQHPDRSPPIRPLSPPKVGASPTMKAFQQTPPSHKTSKVAPSAPSRNGVVDQPYNNGVPASGAAATAAAGGGLRTASPLSIFPSAPPSSSSSMSSHANPSSRLQNGGMPESQPAPKAVPVSEGSS